MIITHKLKWGACLSHQIWPAIEKGWKHDGRPIHFFWGLAGDNIRLIKECMEKNEEWWYVDIGYITEQITRYPKPIIHNYDKTYFRIVKGSLHTQKGKTGSVERLTILEKQGIDVKFKGWTDNTDHILLCPSSPTVTHFVNDISQEEWIESVTSELRQHTDRPIKFRNKPRPGNQWWNTNIKDDLKGCHCLITNMSLAAVDAVINQVPVLTHSKNVAFNVSINNLPNINKPFKPSREIIDPWLNMLSHNQFTIPEIEDGTAFRILNE